MELYSMDEPTTTGGIHPVVEPSIDEDEIRELASSDSESGDPEVEDASNNPAVPSHLGMPAAEQQVLSRSA